MGHLGRRTRLGMAAGMALHLGRDHHGALRSFSKLSRARGVTGGGPSRIDASWETRGVVSIEGQLAGRDAVKPLLPSRRGE